MNNELEQWQKFPIIIRLRDYVFKAAKNDALSLLEFFLSYYCNISKKSLVEELVDKVENLKTSTGLTPVFLLDGWDEVPSEMRALFAESGLGFCRAPGRRSKISSGATGQRDGLEP